MEIEEAEGCCRREAKARRLSGEKNAILFLVWLLAFLCSQEGTLASQAPKDDPALTLGRSDRSTPRDVPAAVRSPPSVVRGPSVAAAVQTSPFEVQSPADDAANSHCNRRFSDGAIVRRHSSIPSFPDGRRRIESK